MRALSSLIYFPVTKIRKAIFGPFGGLKAQNMIIVAHPIQLALPSFGPILTGLL